MASERIVGCLFIVALMGFFSSSEGNQFFVGGKDGWVVNPFESYGHWAERNRFQVNDTLYFKYQKGSNSVLEVNKDDYFSCNTANPVETLSEGNSVFNLDRSGPFFFISGNADNCKKGQKVIIVVMAVRPKPQPQPQPHPPPSSSPSPAAPAPVFPSLAPQSSTPAAESPKTGGTPSSLVAPATSPTENKSGSLGLAKSPLSRMALSVAVTVVLGGFASGVLC